MALIGDEKSEEPVPYLENCEPNEEEGHEFCEFKDLDENGNVTRKSEVKVIMDENNQPKAKLSNHVGGWSKDDKKFFENYALQKANEDFISNRGGLSGHTE